MVVYLIYFSQFWVLHQKDEDIGVMSLWNTALEYFPYNFSALSTLSAGLAQAGKCSVKNVRNFIFIFLWIRQVWCRFDHIGLPRIPINLCIKSHFMMLMT